jgi:hypothetical protein
MFRFVHSCFSASFLSGDMIKEVATCIIAVQCNWRTDFILIVKYIIYFKNSLMQPLCML